VQDWVTVVDARRQFVEHVTPAVARYALRSDRARILVREPFTIQLEPGVLRTPRPKGTGTSSAQVEVIRTIRQQHMTTPQTKPWKQMLPSERAKFVSDFFKEDRDNVWIKVTGSAQLVLTIKDGKDVIPVPPIRPGDPILLTKSVSYEQLRRSTGDLRDFVIKGYLKLLTQEEAHTFFEAKAERTGKSAEELMLESDLRWADPVTSSGMYIDKTKPAARVSDTPEEGSPSGYNPALVRDPVQPRVQHLARQGSVQLPVDQRRPAKEILEDLIDIEESLKDVDLQFILNIFATEGEYKTVRNWAERKLETL